MHHVAETGQSTAMICVSLIAPVVVCTIKDHRGETESDTRSPGGPELQGRRR